MKSHRPLPSGLIRLLRLLGLLTLLVTAGCYINHSAVKEDELPADWQMALKDRMETPESFAGLYNNLGEERAGSVRLPGERPQRLKAFLWWPPGEDYSHPKPGRTVELVVVSPTQLKFIAREGAAVLNEEIQTVRWDAGSHSFVYGEEGGVGRPGSQGPTVSWQNIHLFKGGDGNLYKQSFRGEAGPSLILLPVSITAGEWSQWKLAPVSAPKTR